MQFFGSMPMAIYTCLLVAFLCSLPIWAGPLPNVSLSPYLSVVVPTCAHGCLRSFVADSFPSSTCQSQSDLGCLCTRDSKTGLTLGEGALRCLAAECGKNSTAIREAIRVYDVCQIFFKAKPRTHPTLTATQVVVTTVPSSSLPTSTMSGEDIETEPSVHTRTRRRTTISASPTRDVPIPSHIVTDTSILATPTSTISNVPSNTESTSIDPSTSDPVTSFPTNSQSSPSVTAAAASTQPVLTKSEIAGVTVGSVAAAGVVFGLLALFFCLRGKRNRKRRFSDASFGNDRIVVDEPRTPSPPLAPAVQDVERGFVEPETSGPYDHGAEAAFARPQSNSRWSLFRRSVKPEDIGVAVAPGAAQQTPYDPSPITPVSAASYETTSQLLPDKPTYSLYPPPLRLSSSNHHVSPVDVPGTQAIDFGRAAPTGPIVRPAPAPRWGGTMDTSQGYLYHGLPTLRHVPSDPFLESTFSTRTVPSEHYHTLPAQRPKAVAPAPSPAPVVVRYGQWAEPINHVPRKPVPARLPTDGPLAGSQVHHSDGISALPSHPANSAAGLPTLQRAAQPDRRKSSGKRKVSGKRPATFLSTTSDTSFEDADSDDEPRPPLPTSTLSPVVESSASRPRVAGVRYPVIPTSAAASPSINQTIREVRRGQGELNSASGRSNANTPRPRAEPVPEMPELAGTPLRERQQAPDNSSDRVKPGSAKWSILVAPGLEGIENAGTPKSKTSGEWTPLSTPTRRGR